jgi:EAL domain-containing protein (putative c-di-GMP-specific phosphodiesterase class I)
MKMREAALAAAVDWGEELSGVISPGGMRAVFQPVVRLADRRVEGFEALARPSFCPRVASVEGMFAAAEELGRGADLDWACRRAALQEVAALPAQSLLFLNVQTSALLHPVHGVDQMLLLLKFSRWDPGRVVIEITERERLRHPRRLRRVLDDYWRAGFRFALDDVGEGYSTLEAALTIGPDYLKIAGPVSRGVEARADCRQAVLHALRVGEQIGARVIAEGVESAAQAGALAALGVELGQGYWYGRPASALNATTRAAIGHARAVLGGALPLLGPTEFGRLGRSGV